MNDLIPAVTKRCQGLLSRYWIDHRDNGERQNVSQELGIIV
jgi:hypothetical protein